MLAVSCASATSCTTVGTVVHKPFAERWNGSEWSSITPSNPIGATEASLEGLSCTSSTACMAVGHFHESTGKDKSLAESWNGSAWSELATPAPEEAEGGTDLYGVSCLSSTSCFAVGRRINKEKESGGIKVPSEERTVAETWNGSAWSLQTTPNPETNHWSAFSGVSCISSIACTAVGATYPTSTGGEGLTLGERYE